MACESFTTFMATKHTSAFFPALIRKLKRRRTLSSSEAESTHATATAMHFPANEGLIFLTDEWTNDRYLVDTEATSSIVPCTSNAVHLAPCLRDQMANQSYLGVLFLNPSSFKASCSQPNFGHFFLEKVQNHCCSRDQ
jgi:hypothetical protein